MLPTPLEGDEVTQISSTSAKAPQIIARQISCRCRIQVEGELSVLVITAILLIIQCITDHGATQGTIPLMHQRLLLDLPPAVLCTILICQGLLQESTAPVVQRTNLTPNPWSRSSQFSPMRVWLLHRIMLKQMIICIIPTQQTQTEI